MIVCFFTEEMWIQNFRMTLSAGKARWRLTGSRFLLIALTNRKSKERNCIVVPFPLITPPHVSIKTLNFSKIFQFIRKSKVIGNAPNVATCPPPMQQISTISPANQLQLLPTITAASVINSLAVSVVHADEMWGNMALLMGCLFSLINT